jgi:Flp pilus assembly protein TadG
MRFSFATANGRGGSRRGGQLRRAGGAAAELALLAPFMVAIMLGMFEIGRGLMVKQTLGAAARKGCRTGILGQYGNSDIINDATNIMRDAGFDTTRFNPPTIGAITITVTDPNGNTLPDSLDAPTGSTVSVQVTIPVSSIKWVSTYFLTGTMVESDAVVMMKQ